MSNESRISFSKERLNALPLPDTGKRTVYYDTKTPGLQLRVTHTGVKTFSVYRRMKAGQPERVTLGRFPAMSVEQARQQAAIINAQIEDGASPASARRAIREDPTFSEMLTEMLEHKKKRDGTHIAERTKTDYINTVQLHMSSVATKKLSHITKADVQAIHTKVSKKSERQADKAVAIVSSTYNYAVDRDHFKGANPAQGIQKNAAPSRERFAQPAELPHLFTAIAESSMRDFFMLSLLTGARRSNVQAMAWRDLNLDAGVWRIDMTKNGTPQDVTLSPEAVTILRQRKQNTTSSVFVFPGTGKTGHLVEPKKAWAAVLSRASMFQLMDYLESLGSLTDEELQNAKILILKSPAVAFKRYQEIANALGIDPSVYDIRDLRLHDLRRTLGSWQAITGASLAIIGKSLNHKSLQSTAVYARLNLDPVRQSVNTATQAILEAAGAKEPAEVVKLSSARDKKKKNQSTGA